MAVHSTALIAADASLAPDVAVGAYSVIGAGVTIGAGTWIGPHVVIEGPTAIGRDNRIFQFASIGAAPQDLKYDGEPTRLEIGDRNTFRENCTINRGTTKDQLVTRIASDNLFMAGSHVGHDCVIGSHCVFANYATLGGHVELGDWVHMGGFSGVHQFCKVGVTCLHRQQHRGDARRAAVRDGRRPARGAAQRELRGPEAPRLHHRADPQHPRRVPDPVSLAAEAARGDRAARERAAEQPELAPLVEFLNDSTPRRERVGIVR